MKTVTYEGPTDPADPTTRYWTGDQRFCFPRGVAVPDVPEDVAKDLKATEGHNFKVQSSEDGAGKKNKPTAKSGTKED